ncbi:MAG: helix-turn-helix domain-containing protein [Pseudonocardia sp.]|nr:helix-turn-helix domain-containing protein [Pseudonocardia sp.]
MSLTTPLGPVGTTPSLPLRDVPVSAEGGKVPVEDLYATLTSWLHTLGELGSELDRSASLGDFLDHVATTAATMLGYDYAMVLTMDGNGVLRSTGSYGLSRDYIRNVKIPPARAGRRPWTPVREAFQRGAPSMVSDVQSEPRLHYFHPVFRREGVRAYASFPLRSRDCCLGVLTVYLRNRHEFAPLEITLLSALAGFAASAVRTATLRQERDARLAEQQALLRHRERSAEIHETLMTVVLSRQGLSGIVTALAELLEGTVLIEDLGGRVLALAGQGDRREEARALVRATADRSSTGPTTVHGRRAHTTPVVVDGREVALIRAMIPEHLDGSLARQALDHGAVASALHMLGEQVQQQSRQRTDAELLTELLALPPGDPADEFLDRADRLGYRLRGGLDVLLVGSPERGDPDLRGRLPAAVRGWLTTCVHGAFVGSHGPGVAVLVPRETPDVLPAVVDRLERTLDDTDPGGAVRVVITGSSDGPGGVGEQLGFGASLLRLVAADGGRSGRPRVVDGRRLGMYRILTSVSEPERLTELRDRIIGPLLAYDREHRSELVATLECYLRNGLRAKATAQELVVHVNSLAYRVRRIEEILGLEVRAADDVVQLQFALQLDTVLRAGSA